MVKCNKCDLEAMYDSPENLCADHWFDWFHEGYVDDGLVTQEELDKEKEEFLKFDIYM